MELTHTTVVPCPRDRLFAFLREPDNDPLWCSTVLSSERTAGEAVEVGAVYQQEHKPGPFPASPLEVTLLEIDAPERLVLQSVDDAATFTVTYRLEKVDEGSTRLTQHDEIDFHGLWVLIAPFMRMAVNRGIRSQFDELRRQADTGKIPATG